MSIETVVVLNDFCHVQGGASRVAIDEAVASRHLGLNVLFLGAAGPICDELSDAGVRVTCLNQPELSQFRDHPGVALRSLWNQTAYRAMTSLLDGLDRRHTVVHLHGYTKALTTTPTLAARRAGFPVVCTLHDFFAACPNGAFFDYRQEAPCRLRALSVACAMTQCDKRHPAHKAWRVARGVAQRHVAQFPGSVRDYITLSEQSAALLRPYLPSDARFHPLRNVIDIPRAPPVDVAANDAIVVVGRLEAEKGISLVLRAARDASVPLVFVGDGPLRNAAEAAGATVTGWLPAEGVRDAIGRARCLVFPSLSYETFGLVVDEAAARGVPAIVSDISAPAERLIDGETGWIFPSGDAVALTRCLKLTVDAATMRAAGLAAWRAYWANPSDPERHAMELRQIYETVAASV